MLIIMLFQLKIQLIKIRTFIKSLLWHVSRGLPKAPQNIIDYRYNICLQCPSYNHIDKQCNECGCNINDKSIFLNKLAWADQKCPLNKWNAIL